VDHFSFSLFKLLSMTSGAKRMPSRTLAFESFLGFLAPILISSNSLSAANPD
jgi:hypothetical protein